MRLAHRLWTATVLAIGLSKLGGASFVASAFRAFGFWTLMRIALFLRAWALAA